MTLPGVNPNGVWTKVVRQLRAAPVTKDDIIEAALKVCSREELTQMSRPSLGSFLHLIEQRLEDEPAPTVDELVGIKELVVEHLTHPALERIRSKQRG